MGDRPRDGADVMGAGETGCARSLFLALVLHALVLHALEAAGKVVEQLTAVNTRVGFPSFMPAQMPSGSARSMMLRKEEVSMCHTALASPRGAHMPGKGRGRGGVGEGWGGGAGMARAR